MHARGKQMEEADFERISRATAGFTGADIMNLMNQAAVITVRAVHPPPPLPPASHLCAQQAPACISLLACDVVSALTSPCCSAHLISLSFYGYSIV